MNAACIAACTAANMAATNAALMAARNANRTAEARSYEFRRNEYIYTPIPTPCEEEEHGSVWGNVLIGVLVGLVIIAGVSLLWVMLS